MAVAAGEPLPVYELEQDVSLQGYTVQTFGATEQTGFRRGTASYLGVSIDLVVITSITQAAATAAGGSTRRRQLLSSGSGVDVRYRVVIEEPSLVQVAQTRAEELRRPDAAAVFVQTLQAEGLNEVQAIVAEPNGAR